MDENVSLTNYRHLTELPWSAGMRRGRCLHEFKINQTDCYVKVVASAMNCQEKALLSCLCRGATYDVKKQKNCDRLVG